MTPHREGPGKALTLSWRLASDYVTRAPGALVTPHRRRSNGHAMCPLSTIVGGSWDHAMWSQSTDCPCYPSKARFPAFSAFPAFLAISADSGGPTLPLRPFRPEWPKPSENTSLRLLTVW